MPTPVSRLVCCVLLLAAGGAPGASAAQAEKVPWQPVAELDTKRYAGHWYEIARLDHSFERGLVAVTADYELRADGKYKVTNTGRKKTLDGKPDTSETLAWVPDPKKPGEFKARFFWFLGGEYQVMALGNAPDYGYALVGHPDLEHFWILSREPELGKETLDKLLMRAQSLGYDTSKLIWVEQPKAAKVKKNPAQ